MLNEKEMLVFDIKNSASHVQSHNQVVENLMYNLHDSEERNNAIELIEYIKGNKYESDLDCFINSYINEYVLTELFEKIVSDLDLKSGDICPSSMSKLKSGLFEYIKGNI